MSTALAVAWPQYSLRLVSSAVVDLLRYGVPADAIAEYHPSVGEQAARDSQDLRAVRRLLRALLVRCLMRVLIEGLGSFVARSDPGQLL